MKGDTAHLEQSVDKAHSKLGGLTGIANKVSGALGGMAKIAGGVVLGGGILQAPSFLMSAAQAAADDAASMARLQQAIENTGVSWDSQIGKIENTIKVGQKLGFTDDQVRGSLSLLSAQTGSTTEAYKRLALAQDLSRGANIDLETASRLLGKVTDENVNVLARYGIKVKAGADETELFGAIQQKFGGQAAKFADTTAGKWQAAQIRMTELKESLGTALMPVMTSLVGLLVGTVIPAFERWVRGVQQISDAVGPALSTAIGAVKSFIGGFKSSLNDPDVTSSGIFGIGERLAVLVQTQIVPALTTMAAFIQEKFAAFRIYYESDIQPALLNIQTAVAAAIGFIREHWAQIEPIISVPIRLAAASLEFLVNTIGNVFAIVIDLIQGDWAGAWGNFKDIINGAVKFAQTALGILIDAIQGAASLAFEGAKALGAAIADGIWAALKGGLNFVIRQINSFLNRVSNIEINIPEVDLGPAGTLGGGSIGVPDIPNIPELRKGTPFVPATGPYQLHRGEAVIPAAANQNAGPPVININVYGSVLSGRAEIVQAVREAFEGGGFYGMSPA